MIKFYDNPKTGTLYFTASAGGAGSDGQTGIFDGPATQAEIDKYSKEYALYQRVRHTGEDTESLANPGAKDVHIRNLEAKLAAAIATIEELNRKLKKVGHVYSS